MNWEAIGAIGEVVGALGVIATLGYLATQIRQNTASVRASTLQDMSEASASFLGLIASDNELSRIFVAGLADLEALTAEDRVRFHFAIFSFLRRTESFQKQASENRVRPDEWAGIRGSCLATMSRPGARVWWAEHSERFNPSFIEWLTHELNNRAV